MNEVEFAYWPAWLEWSAGPNRCRRHPTRHGPAEELEQRLLRHSVAVVRLVEQLPPSRVGRYVAAQLLRAGTAPLPHRGEALDGGADGEGLLLVRRTLRELREAERWLQLIAGVPLLESTSQVEELQRETQELIRLLVAASQTEPSGHRRG